MTTHPTTPMTGKNSKVFVTFGDGPLLTLQGMTEQTSYEYRGDYIPNTNDTSVVYLLGAGMTLINMRPAYQPKIDINGILQGIDITPSTANDTVEVSGGVIEVDGESVIISADDTVAISRPAASKWAWNLISVDEAAGTFTVTKGTDTADSAVTSLLTTYGDSAGAKPCIPEDELLVGAIKVYSNAAGVIAPQYILYADREFGGLDYFLLPNVGGVKLPQALVKIHAAAIAGPGVARDVKFTGRYLDGLFASIGTAKEWGLTPSTSDTEEETFAGGYGETSISGWSFTIEQLAADRKMVDNAFKRQGYCGIRLLYSNGYGYQFVGTSAPTLKSSVGAMNPISISGKCLDWPVEYTG